MNPNVLLYICACHLVLTAAAQGQERAALLPVPPAPVPEAPPVVPRVAPIPVPPALPPGPGQLLPPVPMGPIPMPVPPVGAQQQRKEQIEIGETFIEFRGLSFGVSDADLLKHVNSRPSTLYSDEQVKADLQALLLSGRVANAEAQPVMQNGKLTLRFIVTISAQVAAVEIRGNTVFATPLLREQLSLQDGAPTDGQQVMDDAHKLVRFYANDYYTDISVVASALTVPSQPGFYTILYTLKEGERNFVKEVRFEGTHHFSPGTLMSLLKPMDTLLDKDRDLNENVKLIELKYQAEGFIYAKVVRVRTERLSEQEIALVYSLDEGGKYSTEDIKIEGGGLFQPEDLQTCLQIKPGQIYNGTQVEGSRRLLADYYRTRGYADAAVDVFINGTSPSSVLVTFRITAGMQSRVGKINVSGNSFTTDAVILRGLELAPGDLLNAMLVDEHSERLKKAGFFSGVDVRLSPTTTPGISDIDINVVEHATDLLTFVASYSSLRGPALNLQRKESNFSTNRRNRYKGDGIDTKLDLQIGRKVSSLNLKVATPDFFGRNLQLKLPALDNAPAPIQTPAAP